MRGSHRYGNTNVENALAYVCPDCGRAIAFPDVSAGRLAAASNRNEGTREFRVPVELEDLALSIHAALDTPRSLETFGLPVQLGIHVAGRAEAPMELWKAFDDLPRNARARPRMSEASFETLDGLAREWNADSASDVFRWLVVAAWYAVRAGLTSPSFAREPRRDEATR